MFMLRQYVRERNPFTTIEILPSDMGGDYDALETLMASRPDILNHNIETVRRLTPRVRARATYDRTLEFYVVQKNYNRISQLNQVLWLD